MRTGARLLQAMPDLEQRDQIYINQQALSVLKTRDVSELPRICATRHVSVQAYYSYWSLWL